MSRLDDIRARVQAATPGPWEVAFGSVAKDVGQHNCGTDSGGHFGAHEPGCGLEEVAGRVADVDAELIPHAPDDLAYLLAEVERLAATVARVEALAEEVEYEHIARRIRAALTTDVRLLAWADALDDAADRLERQGQATKGDA